MKLHIQLRAEDHAHYSERPGLKDSSLEELGILPFADSPEPYLPNFKKLCQNIELLNLAKLVDKFDQSQLRILISLLVNAHQLKEFDLTFGQTVYYNASSPKLDYISNYLKATPIGIRKISGVSFIVLATSIDNVNGTCVLVERSAILNRSEFKQVFRTLLAQGKVHSPVPLWTPPKKPKISDIPTTEVLDDKSNNRQIERSLKSSKFKRRSTKPKNIKVKII